MAVELVRSAPDGPENGVSSQALGDRDLTERRRVLSGALQLTHMLNEAIDAATGDVLANNNEAFVLLTLHLDGPQRPRDLTALTGLTRGGTTNLIDRLEASELVVRRSVADDRRGVLVEITAEGTDLIDRVATASNRVLTFAAPLIDGWKDHFSACGCELGQRWTPRGGRQVLDHVRRVSAAGATIGPVYRAVFGDDDPSPYITLHILLLATEPGGTRPTWIGDGVNLSSATTTDVLDRMERSGLVQRISGASPDRRVTVVTATEQGRAALAAVLAGTDSTMCALAEALFPTARPSRRSAADRRVSRAGR